MTTDLTVVVTAHDETAVCGPTMRAADLAVAAARARGLTVQTIVGLDAPTEATRAYFHQPHFDHWERRALREPGQVRNALAPETDGRFIAFLDADDLCSENWLAEGVAALDAAADAGERVIVHPELNVVFDGQKRITLNTDQGSPLFTPHYLYVRDYYQDSVCLAPREAHLDIPHVTWDVTGGPSHRDFQWTIETLAAGWRHRVVRDTINFRRCRDTSLVTEADVPRSIVGSLPSMAIDRIRDLGRADRQPTDPPA